MTDVRTLLHDLAADAPRGHGEETADRVVELHRAQDRRRLRLAGVVLAIAVVVAAVPALVTRSSPADTAAAASADGTGPVDTTSLIDLPPRGSLAGDDEVTAAALAADWGDSQLVADPDGRHVSFVGEVPGGQVWALVMGEDSGQAVFAWFVDAGDPALGFQLASLPDRAFPDRPMALLDTAGSTGALVVVTSPGDAVSYAPDGSGSVSGGPSTWAPLTTDDGVVVADVAVADQFTAFAGVQVERRGSVVYTQPPQTFDSRQFRLPLTGPPISGYGDPAAAAAEVSECLTVQGYGAIPLPDGSYQVTTFPADQSLSTFSGAERYCLDRLASPGGLGD